MKRVLVFKTSVVRNSEIVKLKPVLNSLTDKTGKWNFDLEDCDNILRVETFHTKAETVISTMKTAGFYCEELNY